MVFKKSKNNSIWSRLKNRKPGLWAIRYLLFLLLIALFGDFLTNDKPIYYSEDGKNHFPVFQEIALAFELSSWPQEWMGKDWYEADYDRVIWPLIPYSSSTLDERNMNFRSPFGPQRIEKRGFWHYLGTDQIGRDVFAGLVRGTRTALLTGLVAMSIATAFGLLLGLLAGYYGDQHLKQSRGALIGFSLAFFLSIWWIQTPGLQPVWERSGVLLEKILLPAGLFWFTFRLSKRSFGKAWLDREVIIPVDSLVLRLIETINSIPALFLLMAGIAMLPGRSLLWIMIWIGLLSWTAIARFARAEALKVRAQPYIEVARLSGLSRNRIIWRHLLPNTLRPVVIVVAFGFSGVILLEAYLSFLGVGSAPDEVSWGSMIRMASNRPSAWWMALFPGLALFFTVGAFNLLGDSLSDSVGGE